MTEFQEVRREVEQLLGSDESGHGMEHVDRVYRLSSELARKEGANLKIVRLAALLHDVDDYKLFGEECARTLRNARRILKEQHIDEETTHQVVQIIASMGYNKYLEGVRPETLEGKIVSDADMCDAIGSQGLIRVFEYNASKGRPFFDRTISPVVTELDSTVYRTAGNQHAAQHFFDKLLLIPGILMTESGRAEGQKRATIMHDYLRELFREEDAQDWIQFLDKFMQTKG